MCIRDSHWNVHPAKVFNRYSGGSRDQPPFVGQLPTYFPLTIIGQITLRPQRMTPGTSIEVNASVGTGSVRVELLNEHGYRLKGFTKADAVPLESDALRHKPTWTGAKPTDLPSELYSLRVHLTGDATVYAIRFRDPVQGQRITAEESQSRP